MAIEFNCPSCQLHYMLKDEFAGKQATCKNPHCRHVIIIPQPIPPTSDEPEQFDQPDQQ
jgi:hypothetical protein